MKPDTAIRARLALAQQDLADALENGCMVCGEVAEHHAECSLAGLCADLAALLDAIEAPPTELEGRRLRDADTMSQLMASVRLLSQPRAGGERPSPRDVARELVAHPRFEWRPGMRVLAPRDPTGAPLRVVTVDDAHGLGAMEGDPTNGRGYWTEAGDVPDLTDWATAGALLGMLGKRVAKVYRHLSGAWTVVLDVGPSVAACPTLGEAVGRALLAVRP